MASKKSWNDSREAVVARLVRQIGQEYANDSDLVVGLMARGLSDWIQNKVQSLKLETVDTKCAWLEKLDVAMIGTASRDTHESLNTVILEAVASGTITIKEATNALSGTLDDKRAFITLNL
jgi:predicted kinase